MVRQWAIINFLWNQKSIEDNEEYILNILKSCNFNSEKVQVHLNEIGVVTDTKEELNQIIEQITTILSAAGLYPEVKFL